MADRKVLFRSGANLSELSATADRVNVLGVKSAAATAVLETSTGTNITVGATQATLSSGLHIVPAGDSNASVGLTGTRFLDVFSDRVTTEQVIDTLGSLVFDSQDGSASTISFQNTSGGTLAGTWGTDSGALNDTMKVYGDFEVGSSSNNRNATIHGNLVVDGITTSIGGENTLFADNFVVINSGYTSDTAQDAGSVFNVDPAATSFSISGIASNVITVASGDPSAVLSAGDFIIIAGANTTSNDGIFEVASATTSTITIDTTPTEAFSQNSITDDATAAGTFVGTSIGVTRFNTSGQLQEAYGDSAPLSYSNIESGTSTATMDDTYTNGRTIVQDLGPIVINGDATTTGGALDINPDVLAETSAQVDVTYSAGAFTGTPGGLSVDYSGMTSLTNGSDVIAINLDGKTNAGAGDSVAISIDAGFDQGIENASTLDQDGGADFSGTFATSGSGTFDFGSTGNVTATGNPTMNFGTGTSTFGGAIQVNGNTTLGSDASDTVTFTADVASDILPDGNNTRDLGASGSAFAEIWMQSVNLAATGAGVDGASVLGYDPTSNAYTSNTNVADALDDLATAIGAGGTQISVTFTDSGSGIAKGAVVIADGNDTAGEAQADSEANSTPVVGVAETAIGAAASGSVTTGQGSLVEELLLENGLTPTAGDAVYLSATLSGGCTTVAPSTATQVVKKMGIIKDASAYVTVTNPYVEAIFQPEPGTLLS